MLRVWFGIVMAVAFALALHADGAPPTAAVDEAVEEVSTDAELVREGDYLIDAVLTPDTSDLQGIRQRGYLRMGIAPDPLMMAYDGEDAIGVAISIAQELEKFLANYPGATGTPTVVVPVPTPRRTIADRVDDGQVDFTTLTVSRAEAEDLSLTRPLIRDVFDVPVLGPEVAGIETLDDLVGIPIYVSEDGRYARDLLVLNEARDAAGEPPLTIKFVDGRLDDYDLIEMVEIGVIPATVASDFKANFWSKVYTSVVVREDIRLNSDGHIAWAVRSENRELENALDAFADKVKKGTLIGNVILNRYTQTADWIENLGSDDAQARIGEVEPVIRRFAEIFGFEPELVLAQAYQESRLDQNSRSHVGAIGVMQVMPTTAADPVVGIPDVTGLDDNIHAGVKYLDWLRSTYFDDPRIDPLDQTLLTFAAYNAGPGGVKRARDRARQMGLDPNVWFENVEVAITQAVSREPAIYVRNIFKYYVSYRLLRELEDETRDTVAVIEEVAEDTADLPVEERAAILEETTDIIVSEDVVRENLQIEEVIQP